MSAGITDGARRLIAEHIHSVEQLEVLLLLRATPEKAWSAAEVARALVSQADTAETRLIDLEQRGLISRGEDGWRYDPGRREREVTQLAEAYGTRRVAVVGLIFSKPSDSVTSFSDAFRLRKD